MEMDQATEREMRTDQAIVMVQGMEQVAVDQVVQ